MADVSVKELREAASRAHRSGDTEAAGALFEEILRLFPDTPEAVDAVFYLSGLGKSPRRPAGRVAGGNKEAPTKRGRGET
jgi:hypothetical protein